MEALFKVAVNGVEQEGAFTAKDLGDKFGLLVSMMGGCEVKVWRYEPEPSKEFKAGETYFARSLYDHNCVYRVKVERRTDKSVWIKGDLWEKRCAVKKDSDGSEYFMPEHYSCAPVFRAYRVADGVHDLADWEM